jgi:hypothetical protein
MLNPNDPRPLRQHVSIFFEFGVQDLSLHRCDSTPPSPLRGRHCEDGSSLRMRFLKPFSSVRMVSIFLLNSSH